MKEHGTIYAVAGRHMEKVTAFASAYTVEHCYDIESLLADEQVDIIYIATPHTYHYDYMMRALQHGKHVLCEKAITVNHRQLEDPALAKGLVKRDVIKIVTPGTIMDEVSDEKTTVYIASLHDFQFGLAVILCEMTTGELRAQLIDKHVMAIQKVLLGNNVREIVIQEKFDKKIVKK